MAARWCTVVLLAGAGVARAAPPSKGARCVACGLLTASLSEAMETAKKELDQFKEAKEEAIGRVQKAQTRRWLKQEYGSNLYAAVEDAMDKVCALPALSSHRRACEHVREDHEDELARAVLDGETIAFCEEVVGEGCGSKVEQALKDQAKEPARKSEPRPKAPKGKPPAVRRIVGDTFADAALDAERDAVIFAFASETDDPAPAKPRMDVLWSVIGGMARAVRADALLNATLSFARIDVARNDAPWPPALFDPSVEACVPAAVLYPAHAKETPRVLVAACEGDMRSVSEVSGTVLARLKTFVTVADKGRIGRLQAAGTDGGGNEAPEQGPVKEDL
mmetsp:Transcript_7955/g.23279  ORF Transcript_7955/g.23279 Transcript_7955/m.23279 type:complete len:335 (-) Transcript_7955:335-1339(-)